MVRPTRVPLSFRARAYATVVALRQEQGWGYCKIAKHTGLSPSTVYNWVVGRHSPLGSCNVPNLTSSPSLSYLAGAFLGDGSLTQSTSYHYELRLRVRDRDFADEVCACLGSILGKSKRVRVNEKGFYIVRTWSRLLYEYLSNLDSIRQTVDQFPAEFVGGFADAEGSAAVSVSGSRTLALWFYVVLVNTNLELLNYIKILLWKKFRIDSRVLLGRKCHSMWSKVPCYYLKIGRREDQRRFANLIGFRIGRKQVKMQAALSLLDSYGPSRAALEWQRRFEKHGRIWVSRLRPAGDGAPAEI